MLAVTVALALPLLYLANVSPYSPRELTFLREARTVVGAWLAPLSVAGVVLGSTVRAVPATAASTAATSQHQAATAPQQQAAAARPQDALAAGAVISALPAGGVPETHGGFDGPNCGGVNCG